MQRTVGRSRSLPLPCRLALLPTAKRMTAAPTARASTPPKSCPQLAATDDPIRPNA